MSAFTSILVDAHNAATEACDHPADQLYTWFARDDSWEHGRYLCVACKRCHTVIRGTKRTPPTCANCGEWLQPGGFCPTCDAGPGSIYAREESPR